MSEKAKRPLRRPLRRTRPSCEQPVQYIPPAITRLAPSSISECLFSLFAQYRIYRGVCASGCAATRLYAPASVTVQSFLCVKASHKLPAATSSVARLDSPDHTHTLNVAFRPHKPISLHTRRRRAHSAPLCSYCLSPSTRRPSPRHPSSDRRTCIRGLMAGSPRAPPSYRCRGPISPPS